MIHYTVVAVTKIGRQMPTLGFTTLAQSLALVQQCISVNSSLRPSCQYKSYIVIRSDHLFTTVIRLDGQGLGWEDEDREDLARYEAEENAND